MLDFLNAMFEWMGISPTYMAIIQGMWPEILITMAIVAVIFFPRRNTTKAYRDIAAKLGFEWTVPKQGTWSMEGVYANRHVKIMRWYIRETSSSDRSTTWFMDFTIRLAQTLPYIRIIPEGVGQKVGKALGIVPDQDFVGSSLYDDFSKAFVVQTNEFEAVRYIITPALMRFLLDHRDIALVANEDKLHVEKTQYSRLIPPNELETWLKWTAELADIICQPKPPLVGEVPSDNRTIPPSA